MYRDLLLYYPNADGVKARQTNWQEFSAKFGIVHELANTEEDWQSFLQQAGLPEDFQPNYCDSGFYANTIDELCRLGYIENTEFNFIECYSYNGRIFATPTSTDLQSGCHIPRAWYLFVEYFELVNNCKIYFK